MPMSPRLLRPLTSSQAQAPPRATLVSTLGAGDIAGFARSTTGYIKVEWWDATSNVYGTGAAGNDISWSKAAGGIGSKTFYIYSSDASGNLAGSLTSLFCNSDIALTSLDVSGLGVLEGLSCAFNPVTSLRAQNVGFNGGFYVAPYFAPGSINLNYCQLDAAALDQFYTDIAPGNSPMLIFGNPGTAGDNPTIATAKGYTVYGS
jgi:hypothetical protein